MYVAIIVQSVQLFCATLIIIQEGLTALMEATKRGHKNIVKALLERKADTSITDKVG